MANEAVLLRQYSVPVSFTVADGTGIEKGTLLVLSDPNTAAASASDAAAATVAGIAATEKVANSGITKLAVHRDGEFKVYLSGTCTVGDPLAYLSGSTYANYVNSVVNTVLLSGTKIIGEALETGTAGEQIRMILKPSFGGLN